MFIMRRMNIMLFNIILKRQKPKLNYLKENYPDSSTQMQFHLGWSERIRFLWVNSVGLSQLCQMIQKKKKIKWLELGEHLFSRNFDPDVLRK